MSTSSTRRRLQAIRYFYPSEELLHALHVTPIVEAQDYAKKLVGPSPTTYDEIQNLISEGIDLENSIYQTYHTQVKELTIFLSNNCDLNNTNRTEVIIQRDLQTSGSESEENETESQLGTHSTMNDNILNPASLPMPGIQSDTNQLNPSQNNQPPTENANQAKNGNNSSIGPSGSGPSGNGPPDNGPPGGDPPPNGNPGGPPAGPPLQRGIYNPFANIPDANKLSFKDI
ncbi:hypothetical protein V9T40_011171 [Parthenolecanium corni]|uniref:Uncharacterized protein n=1 Tax=Parthenolecanium corni TaxID=536013 RepID=A0AAN9T7E9_9HEMI